MEFLLVCLVHLRRREMPVRLETQILTSKTSNRPWTYDFSPWSHITRRCYCLTENWGTQRTKVRVCQRAAKRCSFHFKRPEYEKLWTYCYREPPSPFVPPVNLHDKKTTAKYCLIEIILHWAGAASKNKFNLTRLQHDFLFTASWAAGTQLSNSN